MVSQVCLYHLFGISTASSGYIIAATTGYLRIRNNKHWLSDVVAGAGTGILSTRLVYHFYPKISKILFADSDKVVLLPFSAYDAKGVTLFVGL
jgi:membrane-associated phospholipid phosphatase